MIGSPVAVDASLAFLTVLDGFLFVWAIFFRDHFSQALYGRSLSDENAYLERTAAIWGTFAIIQGVAFFGWRAFPPLLPVVAGVRFTELFADWVHFARSERMTWLGMAGFVFSPVFTTFFGWFFLTNYRELFA